MRSREISCMGNGFAPYFIWDAVAAFVALLSVPSVAGHLTTRLLFMELRIKSEKDEDG